MSLVSNVLIYTGDEEAAVVWLDREFVEITGSKDGHIVALDTEGTQGRDVFDGEVWAAAANHLQVEAFIRAFRSAPWSDPNAVTLTLTTNGALVYLGTPNATAPARTFVAIAGDPLHGFSVHGPFGSVREALAYRLRPEVEPVSKWVTQIVMPEEQA